MKWGDVVWINGTDREPYRYQGQTIEGHPILETMDWRRTQFIYRGVAELILAKEE